MRERPNWVGTWAGEPPPGPGCGASDVQAVKGTGGRCAGCALAWHSSSLALSAFTDTNGAAQGSSPGAAYVKRLPGHTTASRHCRELLL